MRKGFTLMEVVIVLAIIAILGAVVIPSFLGYTDRARLRSDIQSTRVVQGAMDLYRAEVGRDVGASNATVAGMLEELTDAGYLDNLPVLQTEGAVWVYANTTRKIRIDIDKCSDGVKNVQLSDIEKTYVDIS